jgi:hypothetical protein
MAGTRQLPMAYSPRRPIRSSQRSMEDDLAPAPRERDADLELSDVPARGPSGVQPSARSGSSRRTGQPDPFVGVERAPSSSSRARAGLVLPSGRRRGRRGYERQQESSGDEGDEGDSCGGMDAEMDRESGGARERDSRSERVAPLLGESTTAAPTKGGRRRSSGGEFGDGSVVLDATLSIKVETSAAPLNPLGTAAINNPAVEVRPRSFRPVLEGLCLFLLAGALAAWLLWSPPPLPAPPSPQLPPPPPPLGGPSPSPPPPPLASALPHPDANNPVAGALLPHPNPRAPVSGALPHPDAHGSAAALVATLNRRFVYGHPTNNLSEAGVIVHQFGARFSA